jgi:hypothetical protein
MNTKYRLAERAILTQFSAGMPGEGHTDPRFSDEVKKEKHLGKKSGRWVKAKYPEWALKPIKQLVTRARAYHDAVTLPFNKGVGILPAALILEYGDRMRQFRSQFENLSRTHFRERYPEMVEWAKAEHNGTFDQNDYPPVDEVMEAFYFRQEPVPVPDASHFEGVVKSLLGLDADSVNLRVQDAMVEAQRELMRRLIEPVKAMATRLAEEPKEGKKSPRFNETLVGNLLEIVHLAPKLNIAGDPAIDGFVKDIEALTIFEPETLRKSPDIRKAMATDAAAVLKRLEGYKI